jgi:hypothetical protein
MAEVVVLNPWVGESETAVLARWRDMADRMGEPGVELAAVLNGLVATRRPRQLAPALAAARRAAGRSAGHPQHIALVVASEIQVALGAAAPQRDIVGLTR